MRYDPEQHVWSPLSVAAVGSLFSACPARWWLSGGWAIDHWLGTVTRRHGDIDISVLRFGFPDLIGHLPVHLRPFAAMSGHLFPLAEHADDAGLHNIWVHDRHRDRWVLQINVEEGDETVWRYRRHPVVALSWDRAVGLVRSVPTGTPATQLLWKSRGPRPQDEHDLDVVHGVLPPEERRWLRQAVHTAHAQSSWAHDRRLADP